MIWKIILGALMFSSVIAFTIFFTIFEPMVFTEIDSSPNSTIQYEGRSTLTINFDQCTPDVATIPRFMGSTVIEVKGSDFFSTEYCNVDIGGETENPNWDHKLQSYCQFPRSLKQVTFSPKEDGSASGIGYIDLSLFDQYCKKRWWLFN